MGGKNCITNFHGMGLTTDKLRSMVKKWQTSSRPTATSRPPMATPSGFSALDSHASGAVHQEDCLRPGWAGEEHPQEDDRHHSREVTTTDLKDVVNKLIPDSIARDIEKACQGIYPLHDVHIRKVKVMKRPRFDLNKLMDMHGEGSGKAAVTTAPNTG